MKLFSGRAKIAFTLVFALVVTVAYLLTQRELITADIPDDFRQARAEGALISQSIVSLSSSFTDDLETIHEYDDQAKFNDAIHAANELAAKNEEVKKNAYDLSTQLEIMTKALPNVRSDQARQLALGAINDRLTLISRLINYSNYVDELLLVLRNKFVGESESEGRVQILVEQINEQVRQINELNAHATESMDRFDQIVRQSYN